MHHRHSHSVGHSDGGDRDRDRDRDRGGVSSDQLDRELEAAKERLRRIQLEREALAKQVGLGWCRVGSMGAAGSCGDGTWLEGGDASMAGHARLWGSHCLRGGEAGMAEDAGLPEDYIVASRNRTLQGGPAFVVEGVQLQ